MRRQIVAGNWKMNKNLQEGIELATEVNRLTGDIDNHALVIVAPPFIHLSDVSKVLIHVKLAAQNCSPDPSGAFTGEVSAGMIRSAGASHVIIGHSERRSIYNENDELLNRKLNAVVENELIPIFCIGELLSEREAGNHMNTVSTQLQKGVFTLSPEHFSKVILAYEPVWAIGTGVTASPGQAQEMHAFIRDELARNYTAELADNTTILYGGSCKPSNAAELFSNPDVDGGLIGGASLKAEDFIAIVKAF